MVLHEWWVGVHITMCLKLLGVCSFKWNLPVGNWEKVGSADLRAEHTSWQVAATNCNGVMSRQQNFFFSSSSTKLNQTESVQLVVVKKNLLYTISNLLLRRVMQIVAATYRPAYTHRVICRRHVLQWHVA